MFTLKHIIFGAMTLVTLPAMHSAHSAHATDSQAKSLISDLGSRAIATLTKSDESIVTIEENFLKLFDEGFDVQSIAKFVLARYWRQADAGQQQRFVKIFRERVKKAYASRFREFRNVEFKVNNVLKEEDGGSVVQTTIQKPGGPVTKVDWKVYGTKVYDVIIEGISMSTTLRSDYGAMIQNNGGNIEAFLKNLESR